MTYAANVSADGETETDPSLSVTDIDGSMLDDTAAFDKTAASYSVTLSAEAAEKVSAVEPPIMP